VWVSGVALGLEKEVNVNVAVAVDEGLSPQYRKIRVSCHGESVSYTKQMNRPCSVPFRGQGERRVA
jgi:hypothetical protein